jgi:cystathionine beta-lyase
MTHGSMPVDLKVSLGVTDDLLRVSVGIEDVEDLIADLEQALTRSQVFAVA